MNRPSVPKVGQITTSNIWIIEWLADGEYRTGLELHHWAEELRPGWSMYIRCCSGAAVLEAIRAARSYAERSGNVPMLHIEAHGSEQGLSGPDAFGEEEFLAWRELVPLLQELNFETRCNLLIFVAACTGFAGIDILTVGPRAPAALLVGPVAPLTDHDVLNASKAFYGQLAAGKPMDEMLQAATKGASEVCFEVEPFVTLCYESLVEVIEERVASSLNAASELRVSTPVLQSMWDTMFMLDAFPENKASYSLDVSSLLDHIIREHEMALLRE